MNELNCKNFEQMGAIAKVMPPRPKWRGEIDERWPTVTTVFWIDVPWEDSIRMCGLCH